MEALIRYMCTTVEYTESEKAQADILGRGNYGSLEEVHVCTTVLNTEKAEADI